MSINQCKTVNLAGEFLPSLTSTLEGNLLEVASSLQLEKLSAIAYCPAMIVQNISNKFITLPHRSLLNEKEAMEQESLQVGDCLQARTITYLSIKYSQKYIYHYYYWTFMTEI